MTALEALDLFCCAGGATRGYQRAGFTVTGVDIDTQRNYIGDAFEKSDALVYLADVIASGEVERYSLIHTSPPCQAGSTLTIGTNKSRGWGKPDHAQLIPELRPLLEASGLPYVIEQPAGNAPMRRDVRLCMDMFPIEFPRVYRHRYFELGEWSTEAPPHSKHRGYVRAYRGKVFRNGPYVAAYGAGGDKATVSEMRHALGIDWTSERHELTEAIPPAYTQWIGERFLQDS